MAKSHYDQTSNDEMAVCYAEFCDVFRCRNFLKHRRKKNKNVRNSFTKIMGSQEAFYDLGINVYHDTDEDIMEQFSDKESKALMSMPSNDVLKVLDDAKTSQNFVVGVDSSQSVQDPFGFNYNNDQTEESSRGTRPRGGSKEKQKVFTNSKQKSSNNAKHKSLSDELDDLVNKAVNYVEKKLGRSLFNLSTTDENSNSEEEDSCDPESMIRTQNKCKNLIHDCISPLLVELSDAEYVEMEGKSYYYFLKIV